jgi:hypothetical protein
MQYYIWDLASYTENRSETPWKFLNVLEKVIMWKMKYCSETKED